MAQKNEEELVINLVYQYNSTIRTTSTIFIKDNVLDNLEYHEFTEQLLFEIPQLRRFGKLRLALLGLQRI